MRYLPILSILMVSGFGAVWDADAAAVPGLLEREIPAGSPPRPGRFVEGDRGDPIPYVVDLETLPDGIARDEALAAIGNAFAAWGEASGLRFELDRTEGFDRPASDFTDPDGTIRIQCHDSFEVISDSAILGIGGSGSINGGFPEGGFGGKVSGEEFHRTVRGYIILNHRHPLLASPSTFEEVVCHEIGHILGLKHSSESYPEPDPVLREALMYQRVHADGRGASLGEYDRVTARKAYPPDGRPPGVFPATMTAISVPEGAEPPSATVNSIRLAAINLDGPVDTLEAVLHENSTDNRGTFSLDGHKLIYLPGSDIDEPRLDPSGEGFYDRAFFRIHDGEHSSAYESVRVIQLAHDSHPPAVPDGLPDAWMIEHFGDIVPVDGISGPMDDPDNDECRNLDEFLQETDPMDSSSNTRIHFDASSPTVAMEGELLSISLVASQPLARTIDVAIMLGGSAQDGGIDYLPRGWTDGGSGVLWPAGRRIRTLMLDVADDGIEEIDEAIDLSFTSSPGVVVDEPTSHRIIVSGDVQAPVYDFAAATITVTEQNGVATAAQINVTRSGNTGIASTVMVLQTGGSGNSEAHPDPILIEFVPGDTNTTVALLIGDDQVDEPVEIIDLGFAQFAPYGIAGITQPTAQLLIDDDDDPPLVSVIDTSTNEAGGFLEFVVSLEEISAFPITLRYSTNPGSATPGDDYSTVSGELLIPAGAHEGVISVPLVNDILDETDETIELVLSEPNRATIADAQATGVIFDNDPLPQITVFDAAGDEVSEIAQFLVWLSAPSGREITFSYATGDQSAVSGSDYLGVNGIVRLPPGSRSQTIDVQLLRDCADEETETFTLSLTAPTGVRLVENQATGSILDAPPTPCLSVVDSSAAEGDGSITFTVHLSVPLDTTLVVPYRLAPGTAEIGGDIQPPLDQTVTFPAGVTVSSTSIVVLDDSLDEEDEQFTLELLIDAASGLGVARPGRGTIFDNDAPSRIVIQAAEGTEASGMISTVLRIDPPSGKEIQVQYETIDGTAVRGDDYEALAGSLSIPPLTEEAIVQVVVVDDSRVERAESLLFKLGSWENVEHDGAGVMLTVIDDDSPDPPNLIVRELDGISSLGLQWQGVEGGLYQIETSQDLRTWRALEPPIRVQATGLVDLIEQVPWLGARAFFRILEVPQGE